MNDFVEFAVIGFLAMLVNGAMGMGFGIIASAALLGQGFSAPLVSMAVNAAKLPSIGALCLSHLALRNISGRALSIVLLSGSVGGLFGAFLLSVLAARPLLFLTNLYLIGIGILIIWRTLRRLAPHPETACRLTAVGILGGLVEGVGGSWGPIVTTGLVSMGISARVAIGTSMAAEAAVTVVVTTALTATYSSGHWGSHLNWHGVGASVVGLAVGALPAAAIGGFLAHRLPERPLVLAVGAFAIAAAVYRFASL